MLGKDGWLCLLPFYPVLFVLCHTCDILVPSWVLPSKTNSLGSSSSPFSCGARPQGCDQELHASTEQTQLCSLSGRGSVSYCPVFWCRLQYICLYLWAEISSKLTLINYTPLHTHNHIPPTILHFFPGQGDNPMLHPVAQSPDLLKW